MFCAVCSFCHIGIEIPATAAGLVCVEVNNVGHCLECDESFFFDASQVIHQSESQPTV